METLSSSAICSAPVSCLFSVLFQRKVKQASERDFRYQSIMRNLVRRYVTVEQRKAESQGVTEDDVNEIKQDISAFRCELVEILKNSGMNTTSATGSGSGVGGKKNRQKERRLMKGFNIAPPPAPEAGQHLTPVSEFPSQHGDHSPHELFAGVFGPGLTPKKALHQVNPMHQYSSQSQSSFGENNHPMHKLSKLAPRFHSKRPSSQKKRWGSKMPLTNPRISNHANSSPYDIFRHSHRSGQARERFQVYRSLPIGGFRV